MDCFNLVVNEGETDIDCGGTSCWQRCEIGQKCEIGADCISGICTENVCSELCGSRMLRNDLIGSGMAKPTTADVGPNSIITVTVFALVVLACVLAAKFTDVIAKNWNRENSGEETGLPLTAIDADNI